MALQRSSGTGWTRCAPARTIKHLDPKSFLKLIDLVRDTGLRHTYHACSSG
jgi:hypothetical protein